MAMVTKKGTISGQGHNQYGEVFFFQLKKCGWHVNNRTYVYHTLCHIHKISQRAVFL